MGGPRPRPCVSEKGWPTHLEEAGEAVQPQAWDLQTLLHSQVAICFVDFSQPEGLPQKGRGERLRAGIHCTQYLLHFRCSVTLWSRTFLSVRKAPPTSIS